MTPDAFPAETARLLDPTYRTLSVGLLLIISLVAFEALAVSTAMPTAARDLHGISQYGVAFSTFLVANILGTAIAGILADRHGPLLPTVLGLAGFTAGLATAGLATAMSVFIIGRFLQGIAGGLLISSAYAIAALAYPTQLQPRIIGAFSSAWVIPSLAGPPLAGLLTQRISWRAVFLLLLPLVVAVACLVGPALRRRTSTPPSTTPGTRSRLLYAVAAAVSTAGLVQTIQMTNFWAAPVILAGLAVLGWSLHHLLPPGALRLQAGAGRSVATFGLIAAAIYGEQSFLPLTLTLQHHYTPTGAGLPLLGAAITWAIGAWWQGRHDHPGRRIILIRAGATLVTISLAAVALTSLARGPGWLAYPVWTITGLGAGLSLSGLSVLTVRQSDPTTRGRNTSSLQLTDATLSALLTGLGGTLIAHAARTDLTYTNAFTLQATTTTLIALTALTATLITTRPGHTQQ